VSEPARNNVRVGISEVSDGRVTVSGDLTFASARDARQLGVLVLEGSRAQRIIIDCSGVTRADSAGLAVLLDWLAWGRRKSRTISLENLPPSLVAIAKISEVDGLLASAGWVRFAHPRDVSMSWCAVNSRGCGRRHCAHPARRTAPG
jgi:phospholipid transport system transporter-binding protein